MQIGIGTLVRRLPHDAAPKCQIEGDGQRISFEDVVVLGNEAAFAFTPDELRTAFKHDWAMRWIRYSARDDRG